MTKAVTGLCMGCMAPLGGHRVCPNCGYDAEALHDRIYIKPGSVLESRYIVGRLAHKNGEGAQYIGYDSAAQIPVWIQEYFPHTIAQRGGETGNVLALQGFGAQYKALMSDFVDVCNEVKRLSITEPVVPIDNILYTNNTVYAVYRDLDVVPLETWLTQEGGGLPLDQATELFLPLLNTLGNMHNHGVIHRGISPYTVYIERCGQLYLWDFALSATRTADSELECELFSGYSAPEQYTPNGWQGTWTDVYAVSALIYRTLSGVVPPKSTLVGARRPLVPLEDLVMGLPKNVSDAIADAMRVPSEQRTQVIATLSSHLMQSGMTHTAVYDTHMMPQRTSERQAPQSSGRRKSSSAKYIFVATALTAVILLGIISLILINNPGFIVTNSSSESTSEPGSGQESSSQTEVDTAVPRFVGQMADVVTSGTRYEDRFEFSIKAEYNELYDVGVIYDQAPVEGTPMPEKGTIILYVSKGPELVEMPNLVGLTLAEAQAELEKLGLDQAPEVFTRNDAGAEPGTVLRTTPEAGAEIDPKSQRVYLFVSPEVPVQESSQPTSSEKSSSQSRPLIDESKPFSFWE